MIKFANPTWIKLNLILCLWTPHKLNAFRLCCDDANDWREIYFQHCNLKLIFFYHLFHCCALQTSYTDLNYAWIETKSCEQLYSNGIRFKNMWSFEEMKVIICLSVAHVMKHAPSFRIFKYPISHQFINFEASAKFAIWK